jgi:hypothetical protein
MKISMAKKFNWKQILLAFGIFVLFAVLFFSKFAEAIMYFRNGHEQEGLAEFGKHYLSTITLLFLYLFSLEFDKSRQPLLLFVYLSGILFSLITTILTRQGDLILVALVFIIAFLSFLCVLFNTDKSKR